MSELIEDKINELHSLLMDRPNEVLTIFNNFFGEDKVDMQGFPTVEQLKDRLRATCLSVYIPTQSFGTELPNDCRSYTLYTVNDELREIILNNICTPVMVRNIGDLAYKSGFILVHFPHVRIANEYDRFVDINHLYAKVRVSYNGSMCGCFTLNRSEYTYLHMINNYMHSHVSGIPMRDFTEFQSPCTGSGPINSTMSNLNREFDTDLWELFCLELSKYVQVESIEGTPYHRLESLGTNGRYAADSSFRVINTNSLCVAQSKEIIKDFIPYFLSQNKLRFNYANGSFSVGMSFIEYMLTISNEFISWYNKKYNDKSWEYTFIQLKDWEVIRVGIIADNKFYTCGISDDRRRYVEYNGNKMCTFKGKDVLINITDINAADEVHESILLDIKLALFILGKILRVINYKYGKPEQRDQEGNRISEKVRYI